MHKSKTVVWGGFTKAVKRREAKSKGEKERYKHMNAEFQRIARGDKKAFFSNQCKEIEEINRMGKTRDLFKKIRDTKGTFHAKRGSIKDRNGGRSQDGGGVGWGEHFLPQKFIKRAFKRRVNSTKQLLNAGRGHQAPRKATQLF